MKRVCLFTAHSPRGGGGAAILKSLIDHIPDIEFCWKYTAAEPVTGYEEGYLGPGLSEAPLLSGVTQLYQVLYGRPHRGTTAVVDRLLKTPCDAYWIVSHNEGLRVAFDLAKIQQERPVHLTIHDDWAGALCARSIRYRWFAGAARTLTQHTLKTVSHFDVVSEGMREYYAQLSGRLGTVCHRYIPMADAPRPVPFSNDGTIPVGHIGSLYTARDFVTFLRMLKRYGATRDVQFTVHLWGCAFDETALPRALRSMTRFHPALPEAQVLPLLAACRFVYAMYPLTPALRLFSKTSLPTKLTSYTQARAPILGHGPADSSLAEFLARTRVGTLWTGTTEEAGWSALDQLLGDTIPPERWSHARAHYFGEKNLQQLRQYLTGPIRPAAVQELRSW
jgi:hypothetical protein